MFEPEYRTRNEVRIDGVDLVDTMLSWIIGIPLLSSAIAHHGNSYYFLGSVYKYRLGSADFGYGVATLLPLFQLTIGVALLGRLFYSAAKIMAVFLLCLFVCVQQLTIVRSLNISCGCFGADQTIIGWKTIMLPLCLASIGFLQQTIGLLQRRRL